MQTGGSTRLFFAYGTLRREAPMHGLLRGGARFLADASFQGRLWDLGAYPGVTDSRSRADRVTGELYELDEVQQAPLLDTLDRYEGDAFERALREVVTQDGERHTAQLYVFLGSTRAARRIVSGDYVSDLTQVDRAARRG